MKTIQISHADDTKPSQALSAGDSALVKSYHQPLSDQRLEVFRVKESEPLLLEVIEISRGGVAVIVAPLHIGL